MPGLLALQTFLLYLEAAASAGLVLRFLSNGLHRIYRFFFLYLVVYCLQEIGWFAITRLSQSTTLSHQPQRTTTFYGWFYVVTESVIVCLYSLIVLELYSLVLRDLPGLATVGRRYIRFAVAASVCFSLLLLGFERTPATVLAYFHIFERPLVSSILLFVLLLTGLLAYYPIRLNRNVIYYTIGYAVYFTSKATALFLLNTRHNSYRVLSTAILATSAACLTFWLFALRGEQAAALAGPPHRSNTPDQKKLLQQLEAINASLARARK